MRKGRMVGVSANAAGGNAYGTPKRASSTVSTLGPYAESDTTAPGSTPTVSLALRRSDRAAIEGDVSQAQRLFGVRIAREAQNHANLLRFAKRIGPFYGQQ